jgi:predicted acylesterase/phospholipase RssA
MTRYCDIVMKGGITSGVVYPLAAHELSKHYQFRNVGGASAGAIAAAGVAAAEHGRQNGNKHSFDQLAELPEWLGTNLVSLFQPSRWAKPLFRVLMAASRARTWPGKIARVSLTAVLSFPLAAALGAAPTLALGIMSAPDDGVSKWLWIGASFVLALIPATVAIVVAIVVRSALVVPRNYFGLCRGHGSSDKGEQPLTPWLANLLDDLAGKPPEEPLTFGDLRGDRADGENEINLEVLTTCLTQGRPYRVPFETNEFWFKPDELRDLFPGRIIDWMVAHAGQSESSQQFSDFVKLPETDHLPVVFATRLSLSFPLLIGAVPLYAIDYSGPTHNLERCWFSDGGITSNFPVHFFDSPVPRWPTFAINLRPFHRHHPRNEDDESKNIWMPDRNRPKEEWWTTWDERGVFGKLAGFGGSIMQTMRSWRDNAQSSVPGYGDRIVHISHTSKEGGLNLYMPENIIQRLSERGRCAGELLYRRFSVPPLEDSPLTWDNQRWVRYRSFMGLLEGTGEQLRRGCLLPFAPDRSIEELSRRGAHEPPASYRWASEGQRDFALKATYDLLHLLGSWEGSGESFEKNAPRGSTELRVVPHV